MRVGVIGAGWIAEAHVAILARLDGVELAAVCDVDEPRARALAGNATVYADWRKVLERAIAGEIVSVQATASAVPLAQSAGERGDIEDAATISLRFASGAVGSSSIAWTRDGLPGRYSVDVL